MTDGNPQSGNLTREIGSRNSDGVPDHRVSVDADAFAGISNLIPEPPKRTDRKLNLRIRKEDNFLLKTLADAAGVSSSGLLNRLLHDILLEDLLAVEEDDARALLAAAADYQAVYDGFERPWSVEVGGLFADRAIRNALEYNRLTAEEVQPAEAMGDGLTDEEVYPHSDFFDELRSHLEGRT